MPVNKKSVKDIMMKNRPSLATSTLKTYISCLNNIALATKLDIENASDFETHFDKIMEYLMTLKPNIRKTKIASVIVLMDDKHTDHSKKLDEIIDARLTDIFELIENHLKKIKRSELLPAGVVFVGGGANTFGIEELSKSVLKLPSKISATEMFGNAKTKLRDPSWYVALGLVVGSKDNEGYVEGSFPNLIRDLKHSLKSMVKQLMP